MNRESRWLTDIRDLWGITGNHGFPASGLDHWLRRFGAVPASLAEYYLALGAHKALNATFDGLIVPDDIDSRWRWSETPDTDHLVFYAEYRWTSMWGVAPEDVGAEDPIVHESVDGRTWHPTEDTVSGFLFAQAHLQRLMTFRFTSEEFVGLRLDEVDRVHADFPLLATSDMYGVTDFYGHPDAIIMLTPTDEGPSAWFGADDEEDWDLLTEWFERLG